MTGNIEYVDVSNEADVAARAEKYCVPVEKLLRVIDVVGPELTPIGAYLFGEALDESFGVGTPKRLKAWPHATADVASDWKKRRKAPPTSIIHPSDPTQRS